MICGSVACIRINIKGNDMKDIIQGGTYDTLQTIGLVTGLP